MLSSFEKSPSIFSFVIALELVDFICQAEKPLAQYYASKDGRNSSAVLEEVAGHRPHPTRSNEDGPAASKLSCVSSLWSVGSACYVADGSRLHLYAPTQEFQNWTETLRNSHEAYGLTERLREIYKCEVRAMDYSSKIKALEQRSSYFGRWQNDVAERLLGKKTTSMGKYGTPATKTMENTRISSEGKRSIEGLLREHSIESRLNEFQFTSVTTELRSGGSICS